MQKEPNIRYVYTQPIPICHLTSRNQMPASLLASLNISSKQFLRSLQLLSTSAPPFAKLRWWSALFMDANGIFFLQNNHCIMGIIPSVVCSALSNTWAVNNSWLSAIWSIVGAVWRLTIKAFENNFLRNEKNSQKYLSPLKCVTFIR